MVKYTDASLEDIFTTTRYSLASTSSITNAVRSVYGKLKTTDEVTLKNVELSIKTYDKKWMKNFIKMLLTVRPNLKNIQDLYRQLETALDDDPLGESEECVKISSKYEKALRDLAKSCRTTCDWNYLQEGVSTKSSLGILGYTKTDIEYICNVCTSKILQTSWNIGSPENVISEDSQGDRSAEDVQKLNSLLSDWDIPVKMLYYLSKEI